MILRAVFENVQPKPQPSNGSGSSGSDGSTIDGNKKVEQKINVIHIQNNKFTKFATSNDKIKWLHDQTANL